MEFPLVSFGISGLSYLGAVNVALDDNRLVTLINKARRFCTHLEGVDSGQLGERSEPVLGGRLKLGTRINAQRRICASKISFPALVPTRVSAVSSEAGLSGYTMPVFLALAA